MHRHSPKCRKFGVVGAQVIMRESRPFSGEFRGICVSMSYKQTPAGIIDRSLMHPRQWHPRAGALVTPQGRPAN